MFWFKFTYVSEESIASISRVEEYVKQENSKKHAALLKNIKSKRKRQLISRNMDIKHA
jgi:hypothetical protein